MRPAGPAPLAEKPEPAPIPLAAEILGYVGGAFAVGAAIALMTTFWTPLGLWGRLAIAAVGALLGLVGGFAIGRQGSPGARRLEQFMLAIGTIAVGFFAGIVARELLVPWIPAQPGDEGFFRAEAWAQSVGFWTATATGFAIWWRRRTGLQLAVFAVAAFSAIGSTADVMSVNNPAAWWYSGAAMLIFATLLWSGALLRFLKPETVAYAFGSVGLYLGLLNLMYNPETNTDRPLVMWAGLAHLDCDDRRKHTDEAGRDSGLRRGRSGPVVGDPRELGLRRAHAGAGASARHRRRVRGDGGPRRRPAASLQRGGAG